VQYTFKTEPDDFQVDALSRALKQRRFGVFFQQRVGKTKVGIDFAGALYVGKKVTRVLVVTTLSGVAVWEGQLSEHLGEVFTYSTLPRVTTKRKDILKKPYVGVHFLCVTHDSLYPNKNLLRRWKPQAIVFDEVHELKNPNSQRSRAAYSLAKDCPYVLGLTGTPIAKRPTDLFGIFKAINPNVFGTKFNTFKDTYCIMGGYMGYQVVGYKNTEQLADILAQHSIRVLRKDVMDEPGMEYVTVPVSLENDAREVYNRLKKEAIAELSAVSKVSANLAGVRALRLQQLCGGFLRDDDGHEHQVSTAKLTTATNLISDLVSSGKQVVVFANFLAEIDALATALSREFIAVGVVQGSVPEKSRTALVKAFQKGDIPVLIMQEHTGSMAVCLDKAHTNVYYSLNHRLVDFQQSRDRVMGRGQTNDVTTYLLTVKKSVDEKVVKILRNDEDLAVSIGDKWRWLFEEDD